MTFEFMTSKKKEAKNGKKEKRFGCKSDFCP